MSSTPHMKELLSIAVQLAESLSERIPKSASLQYNCKQTATNLRAWRKNLPADMEFLLKPTGDKSLYKAILWPLAELLCILCQLIWTAHSLGHAPSLTTSTRATEAEQKIAAASAPVKKSMDDLGVWQKPRKGHAPLAVLFDRTMKADERFVFAEGAISAHMGACWGGLVELNKRIERARGRHVGLRLLAGKAT